jgi:hypothetical protein
LPPSPPARIGRPPRTSCFNSRPPSAAMSGSRCGRSAQQPSSITRLRSRPRPCTGKAERRPRPQRTWPPPCRRPSHRLRLNCRRLPCSRPTILLPTLRHRPAISLVHR